MALDFFTVSLLFCVDGDSKIFLGRNEYSKGSVKIPDCDLWAPTALPCLEHTPKANFDGGLELDSGWNSFLCFLWVANASLKRGLGCASGHALKAHKRKRTGFPVN